MPNQPKRTIKSFVIRRGRMTRSQVLALETLWPKFGLESKAGVLDFKQVFGREASTILEIGFGMGKSLLEMAQAMPENNFIGIEVHPPGVGALFAGLEKLQLENVRVFKDDAVMVLQQAIPDESLDKVLIFFPDPWPKKRHHKRRLIQAEFINLIAIKLKQGGLLHLATDWEDYAKQMLEVVSANAKFLNLAGAGNYAEKPAYRPLTRFEQRGQKLGHQIFDLMFVKL